VKKIPTARNGMDRAKSAQNQQGKTGIRRTGGSHTGGPERSRGKAGMGENSGHGEGKAKGRKRGRSGTTVGMGQGQKSKETAAHRPTKAPRANSKKSR